MRPHQKPSRKSPPIIATGSKANDSRPLTLAERLLTAKEVARMLHLSRSMVYKLAFRGDLPSLKIGSARRFRRDDLQHYMASTSGRSRRRA